MPSVGSDRWEQQKSYAEKLMRRLDLVSSIEEALALMREDTATVERDLQPFHRNLRHFLGHFESTTSQPPWAVRREQPARSCAPDASALERVYYHRFVGRMEYAGQISHEDAAAMRTSLGERPLQAMLDR